MLLATVIALSLVVAIASAAVGAPTLAALAVVAAAAALLAARAPHLLFAAWIATSPWGAYWLRFPEERSIVTFDRVVVVALAAGLIASAVQRRRPIRLTLFEWSWLAFAVVAIASAATAAVERGFALRMAVDALLLPILLFAAVRVGLDPPRAARSLFWATVALALALPWTGLYEFATGVDLMPWPGASIYRTGVVRANGPFVTDNSYALVGAIVALALFHLPRALDLRLARIARVAWFVAVASAILTSLVPIFRAVMASEAAAFALGALLERRVRAVARAVAVALLLGVAAIPAVLAVSGTATFRDRFVDPSSAYSRAATYLAALDIVKDAPLLGVGFTNYHAFFVEKYGAEWYVEVEAVNDIGAESYPHSNLLGVWAELGTVGLALYLLSGVALVALAWRRRSYAALALLLVYWLVGLTLQSGIYADLNLYYLGYLGLFLADASERSALRYAS
jgi:O-antigen ligase